MKRKKWWVIAAIVAVCGGGSYWWMKSQTGTDAVRYVSTPVEKGTLSASVSGSGNVIVDQEATIDPTISGTVANLSVRVGDAVKKGQLLFTIVNDDLDVNLANARVSLRQAESAVVSANISKDQARDAYATRTGSALNKSILKQKIDVSREAITIAEQDLAVSRLSYQRALDDAAKRRVVSPIDGTVNEINIKNGDDLATISSGSSKVTPMILGDLKTVKASIAVNEVDISKVALGQKATLRLSAFDELSLSGKVEKMDSLGTIASGVVTYAVTIGLDVPDERVKPGMSVAASILSEVKSDVLMVPNSAVKSDAAGSYVQVMEGKMPEKRLVKVGISNTTDTEIVKGLVEGDRVVTKTIDPNATTTGTTSGGSFRIPGMGGGR
jgi:HlyD family secretion protein